MSSRRNALLAIVVVAIGYVLYRLFVHSNALLTPTLVSPSMDAHRALSPDIVARVDRLLHEREGVRIDRPRLIALTFDDGPYPVTTPLLLDVLRSERVSATFFLIGRDAETYPELTQRIEQDGHEIANHTFSHPNLDELPPDAVRRELLEGAATLDRYVSDPGISTLFRPPHGRYTEDTVRIAQGLGYDTVLWTDDPGDWRSVTPDVLADHVFHYATAPEIVLLHSGKMATILMLPSVIERFRSAGYEFVTISGLLDRVPVEALNRPEKHPV